jgi:ATP-dependent RNA helicase DDX3X
MTTKERGRQTLMFSATFPAPIQKLAGEFMRPYVWIAVGRVGSTTDSITQVIVKATSEKKHKLKLVVEAIEKGPNGRTLVFVQKKRTATWLKKQLMMGGAVGDTKKEDHFQPIAAQDIHGDRSQSQREKALAAFREGTTCTVLVATDVAARGLDISGVEHVINMDLPVAKDDFDSYVHRIGRTGRAGHVGLATSLFVPGDAPAGNGKIAGVLVSQLREAKQEVPAWLEKEVSGGGARGPTSNAKFVSTDVRRAGGGRNAGGPPSAKQSPLGAARIAGGRSVAKQASAATGQGRGRGPVSGGRGGRGSRANARGGTTNNGPSAVN